MIGRDVLRGRSVTALPPARTRSGIDSRIAPPSPDRLSTDSILVGAKAGRCRKFEFMERLTAADDLVRFLDEVIAKSIQPFQNCAIIKVGAGIEDPTWFV